MTMMAFEYMIHIDTLKNRGSILHSGMVSIELFKEFWRPEGGAQLHPYHPSLPLPTLPAGELDPRQLQPSQVGPDWTRLVQREIFQPPSTSQAKLGQTW